VKRYTITTYGCREWLQRTGRINEGELEYRAPRGPTLPIAVIQATVAAYYRLPALEMKSARRDRPVARPRQVAMYLSKQFTRRSMPEIGRQFGGRDHTTVMHAIRQVEKLRREDDEMETDIRALTIILRALPGDLPCLMQ